MQQICDVTFYLIYISFPPGILDLDFKSLKCENNIIVYVYAKNVYFVAKFHVLFVLNFVPIDWIDSLIQLFNHVKI